jgi:hypothetical protein
MRGFVRHALAFAMIGLAAVLSGRVLAQPDPASDGVPADRLEAPAVDSTETGAAKPPEGIEEVTIRGKKSLTQYRLELERAREDIVKAYNEANSNNDNDLVCRDERPTGSRIPQHVCRSVAQDRADARGAREFLDSLFASAGNYQGPSGPAGPPPGGAQVNALVGTSDAQRNAAMQGAAGAAQIEAELERLKKENRQVYRAVVKYVELQKEYDAARQGSAQ